MKYEIVSHISQKIPSMRNKISLTSILSSFNTIDQIGIKALTKQKRVFTFS